MKMNAEELKLIVDTIATLAGHSKDAFIWWLIAKYVVSDLTTILVTLLVVFTIYKSIKTVISSVSAESYLRTIRHFTHPRLIGEVTKQQTNEIIQKISEWKAQAEM